MGSTRHKSFILKKRYNWFLLFLVVPFLSISFFLFMVRDVLDVNIDTETFNSTFNSQASFVYDRNKVLLYEIPRQHDVDKIPLEEVSPYFKKAIISVEDANFYNHRGIRPGSIVRALYNSIRTGKLEGGSTITQQMIKNTILTYDQTISRKMKEIFLSIKTETKLSKNEILEIYINNISFGGNMIGIESASQKYFNKSAKDLSLAESALLAGTPKSPSIYSPSTNIKEAKSRQIFVLKRMKEEGFINAEEERLALSEEIKIEPQIHRISAPHFVFASLKTLQSEINDTALKNGGYDVITTLDVNLQTKVESILDTYLANSEELKISNGSILVLDAKTNEVLAYAGSRNFFNEEFGQVDMILAQRQLGSSVKPITYALALQSGMFNPATIIEDKPLRITQANSPTYEPVNYDNSFHGQVTVRQALANSYNIPAVLLAKELGPKTILNNGIKMGMSSWVGKKEYGYAITLGAVEGSLMDITNTFSTLASHGVHKNIKLIKNVEKLGETVYEPENYKEKVLTEEVAYLISDILDDDTSRAPSFGYVNPLNVGSHQVAVKTGTTDDKRDNYTIGYTSDYVVGVWVGNNDNSPMDEKLTSGLSGAAPIWRDVFDYILEGASPHRFEIPNGIYIFKDEKCAGESEKFITGNTRPEHLCEIEKDKDEDKKDKNEED